MVVLHFSRYLEKPVKLPTTDDINVSIYKTPAGLLEKETF